MKKPVQKAINEEKLTYLYNGYVNLFRSPDFVSATKPEKADKIYALFLHGLEKDHLPTILPSSDYQKSRSEELYRGSDDVSWHYDLLTNENRTNFGDMARATYASNYKERAKQYAKNKDENILSFKLKPWPKSICTSTLVDNFFTKYGPAPSEPNPAVAELSKFVYGLPDGKEKQFFIDTLSENLSLIAMMAGYDVLLTPVSSRETYYQIINREIMMVDQAEYERIMDKYTHVDLEALKALQDQFSLVKSGKIKLYNEDNKSWPELTLSDYMYRYALYLNGYDQKPQVIRDGSNPLKERHFVTIYRGMYKFDHLKELVCDDEYHLGHGSFGQGLYFAPNYESANSYANGNGTILTAKLDSTTRLLVPNSELDNLCFYLSKMEWDNDKNCYTTPYIHLSPRSLYKAQKIKEALTQIHTKDTDEFKDFLCLEDNFSTLTVVLGYDGLMSENKVILVHNRGKLMLSESEYKRITGHNYEQQNTNSSEDKTK